MLESLLCARRRLIYHLRPHARRGVRCVLLAQMAGCPIPVLGPVAECRSGRRGAPLVCLEVPELLHRWRGSLRRGPRVDVPAGSLLPVTVLRSCVLPLVPAHVGSPGWQSMGCSLSASSSRWLWAWLDAQPGGYRALWSCFIPLMLLMNYDVVRCSCFHAASVSLYFTNRGYPESATLTEKSAISGTGERS